MTRAQFTVNGATWRIDGTVTPAPAAAETVTIYNSSLVGGTVLATVNVAANGSFTWTSPANPPAPAPNAARKISVQTSQGTRREGITVVVR